ncbi:MAG TPA: hypothetical protein VMG12_36605 [Polyangiaceae bacterium]|nr:hypothetical protein [Polyangiaceae bacterium]
MRLITYPEWRQLLHAKARALAAPGDERTPRAPGTWLIGIDGAGASGKSSIARQLAGSSTDMQVVALDDFYRPSHERFRGPVSVRPVAADYDLERLRRELLEPLASGRAAAYRRYDWHADAIAEARTAVAGPIVVLEGVYATSSQLAPFLDVAVWVECPRQLRLARGLARDGEGARPRWEHDWMPGEDLYMEKERPRDRAAFVCDGARDDLAARVALIHER